MSTQHMGLVKVITGRTLTYIPSLRDLTGSLLGAIMLKQIAYYWSANNEKPFYKFMQPCAHVLYREGDSWTEELNCTNEELQSALSTFAIKSVKGSDKTDLLNTTAVVYWTNSDHVTLWQFNELTFVRLYEQAISGNPKYLDNSGNPKYLINREPRNIFNTDINTENTTHTKSRATKSVARRKGTPLLTQDFKAYFPPETKDLAETFTRLFKRSPDNRSENGLWIMGFQTMVKRGISTDEMTAAYNQAVKSKLTIKSPNSLVAIAESIHKNSRGTGGSGAPAAAEY